MLRQLHSQLQVPLNQSWLPIHTQTDQLELPDLPKEENKNKNKNKKKQKQVGAQ